MADLPHLPPLLRNRWLHLALTSAAVIAALALLFRLAGASPTTVALITAMASAVPLALIFVFQSLLSAIVEGRWIEAEGDIAVGDVVTLPGPAGPVTGTVAGFGLRVLRLQVEPGEMLLYPLAPLFSAPTLVGVPQIPPIQKENP